MYSTRHGPSRAHHSHELLRICGVSVQMFKSNLVTSLEFRRFVAMVNLTLLTLMSTTCRLTVHFPMSNTSFLIIYPLLGQ